MSTTEILLVAILVAITSLLAVSIMNLLSNHMWQTKSRLEKLKKHSTSVEDLKEQFFELFENYFLKSFSSRLAEYTNPKIEVYGKKILNENYTIVNSLLVSTSERPEIKIDWRIYTKNPENPLIRDLIIEGLSLARTQKEEFSSILNSNDNDINALFKTLKEFSKN